VCVRVCVYSLKINAVSSNIFYNLIRTIRIRHLTTNPAHRLTSSILKCNRSQSGATSTDWVRAGRHAARLRRLGGRLKILGGNSYRTQLTIAITDSATTMKMGVQNNAASEASRKIFGLYPHLWYSGSTLVANEVKKNFKLIYFGARLQFGGNCSPWSFLATSLRAGRLQTRFSPLRHEMQTSSTDQWAKSHSIIP